MYIQKNIKMFLELKTGYYAYTFIFKNDAKMFYGLIVSISIDPEFNTYKTLKKEISVVLPKHLFNGDEKPKIGQVVITLITNFSKYMKPRFSLFKLLDFNILDNKSFENDLQKKKFICRFVKNFIDESETDYQESKMQFDSVAIDDTSKQINQYYDNGMLKYGQLNMHYDQPINPLFSFPVDSSFGQHIDPNYSFGQPYKNDSFNPLFQRILRNNGMCTYSCSTDTRLR